MRSFKIISFIVIAAPLLAASRADASGPVAVWRAISSNGANHTCALDNAGNVWCWGSNTKGQLGNPAVALGGSSVRPVEVQGLGGAAIAIGVGAQTSCAILAGGTLKCWGDNQSEQLGAPSPSYTDQPTVVPGLGAAATSVTVGSSNACATLATGGVSCWGYNAQGALGRSNNLFMNQPPGPVPGIPGSGRYTIAGATAVAAGFDTACALRSNILGVSFLTCWGDDTTGESGVPTPPTASWIAPTNVSGLATDITTVAQGDLFSCASSPSAGVFCWGDDSEGSLGDAGACSQMTGCSSPTAVKYSAFPTAPRKVAAGGKTACAVFGDNSLWCWGDNLYGQAGMGVSGNEFKTGVRTLDTSYVVGDVAVGFGHTCAIIYGGSYIACWGHNNLGQLGDATFSGGQSANPRLVLMPCAPGAKAQQGLTPGVGVCAGQVLWNDRDTLCGIACHACSAQTFAAAATATNFTPSYDYWTNDYLNYSGTGSNNCSADDNGTGVSCPSQSPMRICVPGTQVDPLGNVCFWFNCGLDSPGVDEYFGGCTGTQSNTAGTSCCCP